MSRSERALVLLLRFGAATLLLAALAVVMPFAWMVTLHDHLGHGTLPEMPIIGYLTRSASALYAYHGALVLFLSFDVRRYRGVILFLAWGNVVFGIVMVVLDGFVGMPWWWTVAEGPLIAVFGLAVVALSRGIERGIELRGPNRGVGAG